MAVMELAIVLTTPLILNTALSDKSFRSHCLSLLSKIIISLFIRHFGQLPHYQHVGVYVKETNHLVLNFNSHDIFLYCRLC